VDPDSILIMLFFTMITIIAGGVVIIVAAMRQRSRELEMKYRERLAMIERGVAPGPGRDPVEFERWQQLDARPTHSPATTLGVVTIALGLGLTLLIGFTAEAPTVAIGIGGSIIVLGAAFIVIGQLKRWSQPPPQSSYRPSDPRGPVGP
jgi:hypothetical protein